MNPPRFDVVEYIKRLRNAGASQEIAEIQAQEIEHVIEVMIEQAKQIVASKDVATKQDVALVQQDVKLVQQQLEVTKLELQKQIEQTKNQLLIWMFAMLSGFSAFMVSILAKGFHWF